MMKKIKNQKGAISLFVLLSMMFFLTFMLGAFTLLNRRNAVQVEALRETQEIYKSGASASDIYDSIIAPADTVIPVSNKEQLAKIVEIGNTTSEANYIINGKLYTYKKDADYVLQNDIILDLKEEVHEKNNITIYDYMLYSGVIEPNGHDIYYSQTDGSLWKCISYQNIGETTPATFTTLIENADYYGKSYSSNLYSILEDGMNNYKKAWDENTNFEFMLMYNCYDELFDITRYNRWRQTNNPINETVQDEDGQAKETVDGYSAVAIDGLGTDNYFGGLIKASTNSYLKAFVGDSNYPVASTSITDKIQIIGENTASECILFVRVK